MLTPEGARAMFDRMIEAREQYEHDLAQAKRLLSGCDQVLEGLCDLYPDLAERLPPAAKTAIDVRRAKPAGRRRRSTARETRPAVP